MTSTKQNSTREVFIPVPPSNEEIGAFLTVPPEAISIVVFAHGSGSSRHSGRNQVVAEVLNRAGFATLLLDLLTPGEEKEDQATREHRFDIPLLARRVKEGIRWLSEREETSDLKVGTFGSSTGAAAALIAAADLPNEVEAVVSRGGRPDLADEALYRATAPTLYIVGQRDMEVIELNREAMKHHVAQVQHLELIPGATHLFSEPGTLEQAAEAARDWFVRYLGTHLPSS